ncbi:MAG: RNA polymerase sigma factor [Acidimicrobiales bacterium]
MSERDEEFARVVATHRRALVRYGLRRLVDPAAAEDFVAETFVVAWRHFDDLPRREEELFWLYGIGGRVLANIQRGRQRSLRLETRLAFERESDDVEPRYREGDIEALMAALGALKPDERELIQLVYWEKLSYREMSIVLGCSEKAAGIRLSRARARVRELMNQNRTGANVTPLLREETN